MVGGCNKNVLVYISKNKKKERKKERKMDVLGDIYSKLIQVIIN